MGKVTKFLDALKLDKPRKVRLDELKGLEELSAQVLEDLKESGEMRQTALDRMGEELGFGVHITSDTCFILFGVRYLETVSGAFHWFWPQEYRWKKDLDGKVESYILGVGRVSGEEVRVSHVFSLAEEDKAGLVGIFNRTGGSYTTQASEVTLTLNRDTLSVEHPGKLLNYTVRAEDRPEIREFLGYNV